MKYEIQSTFEVEIKKDDELEIEFKDGKIITKVMKVGDK